MPLAVPGQSAGVASTNLIAHWRFDEGSGTSTRDIQGRFPGVLANGASFTNAGISGSAIAIYPGISQSASVNFGNILPLTNTAYSISAWFRTPPGDTTTEAVLFGKHTPWFENGYYVLLNGDGGTMAGYGCAGAFFRISDTVNDGQWHHVVLAVSDSGELRFHLDGGPPVATAQGGTVILSAADFMVGAVDPPPPARRFNGWIDEIQVYGTALNQASIDFLHTHPGLNLNQREVITFSPASGPVFNPVTITIDTTVVGGQIRYTLDDTDPTITSTAYTGPFSLPVTGPFTIRARAFLNGFPASDIRSASYEPDPRIYFSPLEEYFTNQVQVALSTSLSGASLHWTADRSDPTLTSSLYSSPIQLTNSTVLKARAFFNGFPVSEIVAKNYRRVYAFDNDGIPTEWRQLHFGQDFRTDPRAGAETDPDGDGSTNLQEFLAGTDPHDPRSGFHLSVRAVPELRFVAVPGQKYQILRRSSLSDPNPIRIAEITAAGPEILYTDHDAGIVVNPAFYFVVPTP
jgi:hypothetical protein